MLAFGSSDQHLRNAANVTAWRLTMHASDVMTCNVISVTPDMTVRDAARVFTDNHISGAPVLDGEGRLIGMISEGDLLRRVEIGTDTRKRSSWFDLFSATHEAIDYIKTHALKVCDVMTTDVVTVGAATPLSEVASILETRRIKRVPVTEAGRVVGIVSRANLVQALASIADERAADASLSDSDIRATLMGELAGQKWAFAGRNLVVTDGVVHLWGTFHSMEAVQAVRVAAEGIPGVKRVEDHTEPYPVMPGI
jgi:CBS domain-containing protein